MAGVTPSNAAALVQESEGLHPLLEKLATCTCVYYGHTSSSGCSEGGSRAAGLRFEKRTWRTAPQPAPWRSDVASLHSDGNQEKSSVSMCSSCGASS